MTSRRLRVAVIGCGLIARAQHLPTLRSHPHVDVALVCDSDLHRREEAARESGATALADAGQALASDVEAVLIATHDLLHADLVLAALEGEKHVFVEKPLALEAQAAQAIDELAREKGLTVAVGFQRLHDPAVARAASLLHAVGEIGLVRMHDFCHDNRLVVRESLAGPLTTGAFLSGQTDYGEVDRWDAVADKVFGGAPQEMRDTYRWALNLACHDLSVLVRLFGEPTAIDFADFWPEHHGVIALRFGKIRCVIELAQTTHKWFDERLTVIGRDGTLEASWGTPFVPGIPTELRLRRMAGGSETTTLERVSHESLFRLELCDFVDRVLAGRGDDDSLKNAVCVTRWLEQAIQCHMSRLQSS